MTNHLRHLVRDTGEVPLSWSGGNLRSTVLNWGDAMSPVMVALLTGASVRRVATKSPEPRLAAVGTIGHNFTGGRVWFWGTGCSPWSNPTAPLADRLPYQPPADTEFTVGATRGPYSAGLLGGAEAQRSAAFGDPVWLLPRFYAPTIEKTYEVGVILHISEQEGRETEARPQAWRTSYTLPEGDHGVRLISTWTPVSPAGLKGFVDEVLACKRIVTTSLHGLVVAEAYGIPCLPFSTTGGVGLVDLDIAEAEPLDTRFVDLARGLGQTRLFAFDRPADRPIDWDDLIAAIDRSWTPKTLDEARLVEALPLDIAPIGPAPGMTVFEHPVIKGLAFAHDIAALKAKRKVPASDEVAAKVGKTEGAEKVGKAEKAEEAGDRPHNRSWRNRVFDRFR